MTKKCDQCGAPIEGFLAKISALLGVKKSEANPNQCNKCDAQPANESNTDPNKSVEITPASNGDVADEIIDEKDMVPTENVDSAAEKHEM
ncbi:TPA: hypothetical protein DF272_05960 [Candidatus Falkowbacteria bacterium]|nr:hypothetical protein [Candidatus Falkowbacteria bacterium]